MSSPLDELVSELQCTLFPLQVMVVDDDASSRLGMQRVLERLGYGVVCAASAQDALALLRHTHVPVDLLVTDVQMPGMLGDALVARVRESWPELPVLFVSGTPEYSALPDAAGGRARFLLKPFAPEELRASIHAVLRPTQPEPDPAI